MDVTDVALTIPTISRSSELVPDGPARGEGRPVEPAQPVGSVPPMREVAMRERAGMLDAAEAAGPDAPTLCGGWTVHDLLAHVWVREHEPVAVPGLVVPAFHGVTVRRERAARDRWPFVELLARLRRGMPFPAGLPVVRELGNVHEFFVHHEDIRRANGAGPRPADDELDEALWVRLRAFAPVLLRRVRGVQVVLRRPDGARAVAHPLGRGPLVTVTGPVPELFLYCFNRKEVAAVTVEGDGAAASRLAATPLGL